MSQNYDYALAGIGLSIALMPVAFQVSILAFAIVSILALALVGYCLFVAPPVPATNTGQLSVKTVAPPSGD